MSIKDAYIKQVHCTMRFLKIIMKYIKSRVTYAHLLQLLTTAINTTLFATTKEKGNYHQTPSEPNAIGSSYMHAYRAMHTLGKC